MEGLTDSLRRELRLFGIRVVLIQPGPLKTAIWEKNLRVALDYSASPYQSYLEHAAETIRQTEKNALPLHHLDAPIIHALEAPFPKSRYLIHKNPYRLRILATFLPASWVDHLVHKNLTSGVRKIRPV
jgi:short-subunit dehydrogenase